MTKNFEDLITLLSATITGNSDIDVSDFSFSDMYSLAKAQQVHTIVFPVIQELKAKHGSLIADDVFGTWETSFFKTMAFSFQRNQYMNDLIQRLEDLGIRNCILKGRVLSELYPVPESRVSSDVDLLIPERKDLKTVIEMLAKDGFRIGEVLKDSHQIECRHRSFGLIEIHTDIYDDIAKNVWFENSIVLSDEFVKQEQEDGTFYYTLPVTDGAIFITVHFLKHFLSHGCGIRQLLDMLMYLKKHEDNIDWQRYNALFAELKYLKFIRYCQDIGNRFFAMGFVVEQSDNEVCRSILTDMENGGVFGGNEEYRTSFTYHFTKRRSTTMAHGRARAKKFAERSFDFVKERRYNPVLIVKDLAHRKKREETSMAGVNERLALFRDLGFFEK